MVKIKGFIEEVKNHKIVYILLFCVICVGVFVRMYNFQNNIFFEIDQARDYRLIHNILEEGIGEFPLVGPKAGGTFFRLGSIFYVPSLVSSYILGLSVTSMVLPELLFSILTIPLFYLFVREFFCRRISLYLVAILATSLFAVEYAHFSWNPNAIPFFLLLTFYAILRYSRASDRNKVLWISLMAIAMSITMQLHTIALIGTPIIIVLYFLISKTKISIKNVIIFSVVTVLMFLPLIGNDILTKGENSREFYKAITKRNDVDDRTTIPKQGFMNIHNTAQFYTIILTSNQHISRPIRVESSYSLRDMMDKNLSNDVLRNNIIKSITTSIFLVILLSFFLKIYITKYKSGYFTEHKSKHNFILLIVIWQIVYILIFYPLSLKVDARFFLSVMFIPIIIVGFLFTLIELYIKKYSKLITLGIAVILIILNFINSYRWLVSIDNLDKDVEKSVNEYILEQYFTVTNKQWEKVIDKIDEEYSITQDRAVYVDAAPYYIRPLLYLLDIDRSIPVSVIDVENIDKKGLYFLLRETKKIESKGELPKKIEDNFEIENEFYVGTVTLFQLKLKNDTNNFIKKDLDVNKSACYLLDINIEARDKCKLKDIRHILQ